MVETANPDEFLTQSRKRKLEECQFIKVRLEVPNTIS
jgi:hypothetical protein